MVKRRHTHVSDNIMVDESEKKATLHGHHKSGSLRKETAKHTLRCLLGCNIGEGIGAAVGFCAWNEHGLDFDISDRTSICNGLCIYYDPYAQNYVTKTSSKSNSSWRHGKYSRHGNCRNFASIVDTGVYACSTNRCIILDGHRNNIARRFCSIISSHVLGYETRTAARS